MLPLFLGGLDKGGKNTNKDKELITAIGGCALGVLAYPISGILGGTLIGVGGLLMCNNVIGSKKQEEKATETEVTLIEKVLFERGIRRYIREEDRWEICEILGVEEVEGKAIIMLKVPEAYGGTALKEIFRTVIKDYYKALDVIVANLGGDIYEVTMILSPKALEVDNWREFWLTLGVKNSKGECPKLLQTVRTKVGVDLIFSLPLGISTHKLKSNDIAIKETIDAKKIEIEYIGGHRAVIRAIKKEVPKQVTKSIRELIQEGIVEVRKGGLKLYLGESIEGSYWGDLVKNPHLVEVGATNSGKSTHIKMMLFLALILYRGRLEMYLIDLKQGAELNIFEGMQGVVGSVSRTVEEADEVINKINKEVEKRGSLFRKLGVSSLEEYNRKVSKEKQLPYIILTIEEYVRYKGVVKTERGEVSREKLLAEHLFQIRAFGIYNIVTLQDATKECMKPQVKASFGYKVGLLLNNKQESLNFFGDDSLSKLRGRGHAIIESNGRRVEVQGKNIDNDTIKAFKGK